MEVTTNTLTSTETAKSKLRIVLIGSPNSGKSSLFNWLTGRQQKVVNYPGSTIEVAHGSVLKHLQSNSFQDILIFDTPGTYSLFPKSPDEEITQKTIFSSRENIDQILVVLDSTQLSRQLPLIAQLKETAVPLVVAVTMHDLHARENSTVNVGELEKEFKIPFVLVDGLLGGGVKALVQVMEKNFSKAEIKIMPPTPWTSSRFDSEHKKNRLLLGRVSKERLGVHARTEAFDKVFLHPLFGGLIFFAFMTLLFSSIYWLAAPLMDFVDGTFSDLATRLQSIFEGATGFSLLLSEFLSDGVLVGLGSVFVFVPQILILFIGISILEDSGYLARAAAIADKPLSLIGMNGKAFVPLLSGFACAVPAMMSARAINSKKEKWLAMVIIPLMTCSARLPVYALLIGFLFFDNALIGGLVMASLYVGAILVAAILAGILSKLVKEKQPSFFAMELPLYRRPRFNYILKNSLLRTKSYIVKTGPVILVLSILIWVFSTFPNYKETDSAVRFQTSYMTQIGHNIEPIFKPMGVDWRVGVGLLAAFAAREVFVASLAVVLNVAEVEDEDSMRANIIADMKHATFSDGTPVFTMASVAALLVFFMIALQCISTSAVALKEMGSWKFAWAQLIGLNIIAYALAVMTYQILS
jgi:ferrous iron transport protein B